MKALCGPPTKIVARPWSRLTRRLVLFKGVSPVQWLANSTNDLNLVCGFESCLIHYTRWKWVKSHVSIESYTKFWFKLIILENIGSQMGHTDKKTFKKTCVIKRPS